MIKIIAIPPMIVLMDGCSLIKNQTQIGPNTVSRTKNNSTSWAGIYLGANVNRLRGRKTKNTPIIITNNLSIP